MAFVSQTSLRVHRGRGSGFGMSVKFAKSGSTSCYVSSNIRNGCRFIEVEIDEITRQVRVRACDESGAKLSGASGGQFSLSKSFARKVIPSGENKTYISMEINHDGWWYGSYGEAS